MARINLLPWREELRQERKKEFLVQLAGVAILAALGCLLWVQLVNGAIESQQSRNRMLTVEITSLEKRVEEITELKKKKAELKKRMDVIRDLEGKRSIVVHYFDELATAMPDGVYITSLERKGEKFFIVGVSESNQRISALMRELDDSEWFTNPNLKSVVADEKLGPQAGVFEMDLDAIYPESIMEGLNNG